MYVCMYIPQQPLPSYFGGDDSVATDRAKATTPKAATNSPAPWPRPVRGRQYPLACVCVFHICIRWFVGQLACYSRQRRLSSCARHNVDDVARIRRRRGQNCWRLVAISRPLSRNVFGTLQLHPVQETCAVPAGEWRKKLLPCQRVTVPRRLRRPVAG